MGISGLLPLLRSVTKPVCVSEYRDKTVAIDGYSWLHKGIYNCAQELCMGQPTDKYSTRHLPACFAWSDVLHCVASPLLYQ